MFTLGGQLKPEVRSESHGLTPVGHRQSRIHVRCFEECAKSLSIVEGVQQPQALVEQLLSPRRGGADLKVERAKASEIRGERRLDGGTAGR
jgi:hypothetical protein